MLKNNKSHQILILSSIIILTIFFGGTSCKKKSVPKPRGYFRIDLPEKEYQLFDSTCPYTFEYPVYSKIVPDSGYNTEPCWINILYPAYNANIHVSYKKIDNNLNDMIEDAHKLVYKHTIKADAINEEMFRNYGEKVYGILYDIHGDAASSLQFWLTDSTNNYLRGALYFMVEPEPDSLAPVIAFIKEDITHMIETMNWKK